MKRHQIQAGPITVNLPDENQTKFTIFHDLAELFGEELQKDAVKKLRDRLKDVKPKASIDFESDNTFIATTSVGTIVKVITTINELSIGFQQDINLQKLESDLQNAKNNRPQPKPWEAGDVFAIPLANGTFTFGQVLEKFGCTCALFEILKFDTSIKIDDFKKLKVVSILHLSNGDLLNNGEWTVIFNQLPSTDPNSGSCGMRGQVGSRSFGQCGVMTDLANAYWGLEPWNVMYDEKYYDNLLIPGLSRPKTAKVLSPAERTRFRRDNFGID